MRRGKVIHFVRGAVREGLGRPPCPYGALCGNLSFSECDSFSVKPGASPRVLLVLSSAFEGLRLRPPSTDARVGPSLTDDRLVTCAYVF